MSDSLSHRRRAVQKTLEDLPDYLPPDEATALNRRVQDLLAQGDETALIQAADALMDTPAGKRLAELLDMDEDTLRGVLGLRRVLGLPGDPNVQPRCYQCENNPPHKINEADIEAHDVEGRPLCPYDGTVLHKISDDPCPEES